MNNKLEVLEFINKHEDWQELLSKEPYFLKIKQDGHYYLLSYNMIDSDMSLRICQECRGLIIKEEIENDINEHKTIYIYTPVCIPFYKFFNYGESNAHKLNGKLRVQEKIDGSIIKVWWDIFWHISTNGTINAENAELQFATQEFKNYNHLFNYAWENSGCDLEKLDKSYTYMFELVSPYNRIVVPYTETSIYHIGTRNNITLEEKEIDLGIKKPKTYDIDTLEDAIKVAEELPFDQEGYVVVDENYNRVKVKSPAYLSVHYLRGQFNTINYKTILEIIMNNGQDDVLSYYPEYQEHFDLVQDKYNNYVNNIQKDIKEMFIQHRFTILDLLLPNEEKETRKQFAMWAKEKTDPSILFKIYDFGKDGWEEKFLKSQTPETILRKIGLKDNGN